MCFHHLTKGLRPFIAALLIFSTTSYAADPHIAVSAFTTTANKQKPSDTIPQLTNDIKKIYFFTDLRNFQGQTLTHEWSYNGWVAQRIPFTIKGNRWRVSSNKSLKPRGKGTWTVKIVNEAGHVIQKSTISYTKKSTSVDQAIVVKNTETSEAKKEAKTAIKKEITPKAEKTTPASKKVSNTEVEAVEKKLKEPAKTEDTRETVSNQKAISPNASTSNKDDKTKTTAKDKKDTVDTIEANTTERVKKTDTNTTTEATVTQAKTKSSAVSNSATPLPTITASESNEKNTDDHIGDCDDDDESTQSTGKQQVKDE